MKLLKSIRYYKVYSKILISYISIITLCIILVCIILFQLFSFSSTLEINRVSEAMLSQISYSSDMVYEQMYTVGSQMLNDNNIMSFMFEKEAEPVLEYQISKELCNLKVIYPFINSIMIYNGNIKKYLNTEGINIEVPKVIVNQINNTSNDNVNIKYSELIPRIESNNSFSPSSGIPVHVLTYIIYPNLTYLMPAKYAMVVSIRADFLQDTMRKANDNLKGELMIMDPKGIVLSDTHSGIFMKNMYSESHIKKIIDSHDNKGYFIEKINGERQLINFIKSEKNGWIYVSIKPYHLLLSSLYTLRNIVISICVVFIFIGILISFVQTKKIYNPLQSLLKKVGGVTEGQKLKKGLNEYDMLSETFSRAQDKANSLEMSLKSVFPVLEENYFNSLLTGNVNEWSNAIKSLKESKIKLDAPNFCVLVFKIDRYDYHFSGLSRKDQGLLRFAICNIASELIGNLCENNAVNTDKDHVVMLMQLKSPALPQGMTETLAEIQKSFCHYFKFTLTIGIGDIVDTKENIYLSYQSADDYASYRILFGHGSVIDHDKVKSRISEEDEYPVKLERNIVDALQLNNKKAVEKEIHSFVMSISAMAYKNIYLYINQLLLSILKHFNNSLLLGSDERMDFHRLALEISKKETIEEVETSIREYCFAIIMRIEEKKKRRNMQVITNIEKVIREQYIDPNLCLDGIAEQVNLSSNYLGKLFKTATNLSFNDYLNNVRLDKAKELLKETSDSSAEICRLVGISNNSYFFTLFKKTNGMTPNQYRNQISQEAKTPFTDKNL